MSFVFCQVPKCISLKLEKIAANGSRNALWKETRLLSRDPNLEFLALKDDNGQRLHNPEQTIEHTAHYFEGLFTPKPIPYHPYYVGERPWNCRFYLIWALHIVK